MKERHSNKLQMQNRNINGCYTGCPRLSLTGNMSVIRKAKKILLRISKSVADYTFPQIKAKVREWKYRIDVLVSKRVLILGNLLNRITPRGRIVLQEIVF